MVALRRTEHYKTIRHHLRDTDIYKWLRTHTVFAYMFHLNQAGDMYFRTRAGVPQNVWHTRGDTRPTATTGNNTGTYEH